MAFPVIPVHTFPGNRMFAMMIETIQIGVETRIEPALQRVAQLPELLSLSRSLVENAEPR